MASSGINARRSGCRQSYHSRRQVVSWLDGGLMAAPPSSSIVQQAHAVFAMYAASQRANQNPSRAVLLLGDQRLLSPLFKSMTGLVRRRLRVHRPLHRVGHSIALLTFARKYQVNSTLKVQLQVVKLHMATTPALSLYPSVSKCT